MKTLLQALFGTIYVSLLVTSCSPVLYTPVGQNVPLFREKGEATINVSRCMTDSEVLSLFGEETYADGFNVQGALAVDSNLAIISSFYSMKDAEEAGAEITGHGNYFDVGIGKFWTIDKSSWIGEVFIGTGFGSIKNKVNLESLNVKYFTPFIQPSIGYRGKNFEFAFTPKIILINYTSFSNELTEQDKQYTADTFYQLNKTKLALESGFTFRVGWENVKVQLQTVTSSFRYSGWDGYPAVNYFYMSFGVFFRIQPKQAPSNY